MELFAERLSRFRPSPSQLAALRVRELIAQGHDIVKLTTGEPDFPTPDIAKDAAIECMRQNEIRYTPVNGTEPLRKAVQHKFERDNGIAFGLDEITVGAGTKQILFNALMATVQHGDDVLIPAPYWTSYPDMVKLAGGTPVIVSTRQEDEFKMTAAQLQGAITDKTKWLVFSSPGNPTGATYSADEIKALTNVLLDHDHVHILCDDVYEHLIFDGRVFANIVEVEPRLRQRTVLCNGVSKAYSMTGWRVGFAGGPKEIISAMSKMQSQSTAGISAVSQAAATAVLNGPLDYVRERTLNLEKRRDILFGELAHIPGLRCQAPQGAMYLYCGCPGVIGKRTPAGKPIQSDTDFVMYLLDTVGVATVQGEAYGMSPYFRASFCAPEADLRRGGALIRDAVARLDPQ